jgi:hypothetical protein
MPNESKAPEEYVSDALDLMVKARWVKQYGQSSKGCKDHRGVDLISDALPFGRLWTARSVRPFKSS